MGSYIECIIKINKMGRQSKFETGYIDQDYQMGLTAKDRWEGNEDEYINHLLGLPSYRWRNIDGKKELATLRGFESVDDHFADYDNPDSYAYGHSKGRGYFDWMLTVRDRYNELRQSGEIKDIDKAKAEREEHEYWVRYYDENPQFNRPKGYENDGSISSDSSGGGINPKFAQIMKNLGGGK
jgi:hypothetical protein